MTSYVIWAEAIAHLVVFVAVQPRLSIVKWISEDYLVVCSLFLYVRKYNFESP